MKNIKLIDSYASALDRRRRRSARSYSFFITFFKFFFPFLLFLIIGKVRGVIFGFLFFFFFTIFFDHQLIRKFTPSINIWFGVPGSGKTSMGAYLTKHSIKQFYKVLSNVDIKGAYRLDPEDLGKYDMSFDGDGAHVVYDEGSLDFDNRQHSKFANSTKPLYFALHRHMNNRVDVFSQGYDIDKRIRDRAGSNNLFYLKKIPLKGFIMYRRIKKVLYIKKDDKQMIDGFEYTGLPRILYTRTVWKSFDTLDMSMCPKLKKEWILW